MAVLGNRAGNDVPVEIVPVEILPSGGTGALESVRGLFEEYWQSFGFTPCFQSFGEELAGLPGAYAPPTGRLALALVDGQRAGCIALRRVDADRAEPKRLYVRPAFRGHGLGRALLEWVMNEARSAGYKELVGDTMPVMKDALVLYDRMGFERAGLGAPVQASASAQIPEEPILIRISL
jgi:putative acetyltransferase